MNIPEVCAAFKQTLQPLGVQVDDFVSDSPLPPCIEIYVDSPMQYDPNAEVTFVLLCLAGTVDMQDAQQTLMGWLSDTGPTSIPALIDADSTLGGTVSSVIPFQVRTWGLGAVQEGRARLLQAELVCNVLR